jgi:hypothetical protein
LSREVFDAFIDNLVTPKLLLHLEAALILLATCIAYHLAHASWLWFALLFLTPDLFMLGYLANPRVGAAVYNSAHTYGVPLAVIMFLAVIGEMHSAWLLLIWIAHIAFDRLMGYGLKYASAFKDTHLQRI